jgi:hypothetical protein
MNKEQILIELKKYKESHFVNYITFVFLNLLTNFKEKFYTGAENIIPAIYAEMVTLSTSPNCSCRTKVIKYVDHNVDQIFDFIINWVNATEENIINEFFTFLLSEIDSQNIKARYFQNIDLKTKRMAGNVLIIEDDPIEYRKVIDFLQKENFEYKDFNLFSLIDGDKKYLKFYFY